MSPWLLSFAAYFPADGGAGYGWCLERTGEANSLSSGNGIVPPPFGADPGASAWVAAGKSLAVLADALESARPADWPGAFVRSHHEAVIRGLKAADICGPCARLHARCLDVLLTRVAPWGVVDFEAVEESCNGVAVARARDAAERIAAA